MTPFAVAFHGIVPPRLRPHCRAMALGVLHGEWSFTAAAASVMRRAGQLGAYHLPDNVLAELADWIDATILTAISDIETRVPEATDEILDEILGAAWRTR